MSSFFDNKVFIVTGASSGIGRALAIVLARNGARVVAMARSKDKLESLQSEHANCIVSCPGDVTIEKDCVHAVSMASGLNGSIDGLIHNAGISMRGLALASGMDVFRKLMEVNFFSMINLYHASADYLKESKGHLVAISSVMGRYATQQRSGYCASKHALQGFMDSVRLELVQAGVHAMVVSPGFVKTNISRNALGPDGQALGLDGPSTLAGLDPLDVAKQITRAIRKRKRDLYPAGFREQLGLFMTKWVPGLLDRMLLNVKVT